MKTAAFVTGVIKTSATVEQGGGLFVSAFVYSNRITMRLLILTGIDFENIQESVS